MLQRRTWPSSAGQTRARLSGSFVAPDWLCGRDAGQGRRHGCSWSATGASRLGAVRVRRRLARRAQVGAGRSRDCATVWSGDGSGGRLQPERRLAGASDLERARNTRAVAAGVSPQLRPEIGRPGRVPASRPGHSAGARPGHIIRGCPGSFHRSFLPVVALAAPGWVGDASAQNLAAFEHRTTVHVLPNGWTFIICERPGAPVFSFATHADVGAAQDPKGHDRPGAHVRAHGVQRHAGDRHDRLRQGEGRRSRRWRPPTWPGRRPRTLAAPTRKRSRR